MSKYVRSTNCYAIVDYHGYVTIQTCANDESFAWERFFEHKALDYSNVGAILRKIEQFKKEGYSAVEFNLQPVEKALTNSMQVPELIQPAPLSNVPSPEEVYTPTLSIQEQNLDDDGDKYRSKYHER